MNNSVIRQWQNCTLPVTLEKIRSQVFWKDIMHNLVAVGAEVNLINRIAFKSKQTKNKAKTNNDLPNLVIPDGQAHELSLQLLAFYPLLKKFYCHTTALFPGRWPSPSFPLHQTENQELLPDLEKISKKLLKTAS